MTKLLLPILQVQIIFRKLSKILTVSSVKNLTRHALKLVCACIPQNELFNTNNEKVHTLIFLFNGKEHSTGQFTLFTVTMYSTVQ
jgi:hypothetical protein